MSEKTLNNIRIVNKHDVEANWLKATNFIPKKGEIIVYDKDFTYNYERFKIGDGSTVVSSLPFADANKVDKVSGKGLSTNDYTTAEKTKLSGIAEGANKTVVDSSLSSSSINPVQNKIVNAAIEDLKSKVGESSVESQIASAQIVYVGPTKPTDTNIKVWINTAEDGTGVVPVMPRVSTVSLPKASWTGSASPYYQTVNINTVTAATKIELNPTVAQIVSLQNDDIALMAENNNGTVKVYSFGGKPSSDMTMQVTLTEVSYV